MDVDGAIERLGFSFRSFAPREFQFTSLRPCTNPEPQLCFLSSPEERPEAPTSRRSEYRCAKS